MTRIGVDVGGTFTDLVAIGPRGLVVAKVPSTPDAPERGIWDAYDAAGLDGGSTEALIHGTTIATNALLERKGARVVLVTTEGFEDLLELRRQDRAALYDLARQHPPPLVPRERMVGVRERMGPAGTVVALTDEAVAACVAQVKALDPEAVGVSLLFAFRHPEHEVRLAAALRAALDVPVIVSHELVPRIREYERTSTVAAEAFLRPRAGSYVARFARDAVARGLEGGAARVLASNGGALRPELAAERAVWMALSGPAGGIQGAALVGAASGFADLLTLDMGGTSADAGVVRGGEADSRTHGTIAGVSLAVPHIFIETVSAGGGSIGWLDSGGALRVGPESAGAVPGPACYGRGGTRPAVTDAFVTLGWIPDGSTLGGSIKVSRKLADRAVGVLAAAAGLKPAACALGMIRIAEATMARALRRVSVERGLDPGEMTLVAFGGAGPLSGCALAELLGVKRVLFPPHAGALSALGMAAADDVVEHAVSVHLSAADFAARAPDFAAPLAARVAEQLPGAAVRYVAECRYVRQGYELDVPCGEGAWERVGRDFHEVHQRAFGHRDAQGEIQVVALRAIGTLSGGARRVRWPRRSTLGGSARLRIRLEDGEVDAAGADWEGLNEGKVIAGPAVVEGLSATALIPPGWVGRVNRIGAIVVEPGDARPD
ncbi:MAG TPA: hydantoinase/oxoprolinase family protein [Gemmatimonadales bacterium]|nr:hydantoinase/oxoprolinase family protein [Gemmatimonadales bacterium]